MQQHGAQRNARNHFLTLTMHKVFIKIIYLKSVILKYLLKDANSKTPVCF